MIDPRLMWLLTPTEKLEKQLRIALDALHEIRQLARDYQTSGQSNGPSGDTLKQLIEETESVIRATIGNINVVDQPLRCLADRYFIEC